MALEGDTRNPLTYLIYDLMTGDMLAELPFTGVKFSQRLNTPGEFNGALNYLDPGVRALNQARPHSSSTVPVSCCGVASSGPPTTHEPPQAPCLSVARSSGATSLVVSRLSTTPSRHGSPSCLRLMAYPSSVIRWRLEPLSFKTLSTLRTLRLDLPPVSL
jgi:hypothetical protein